jgi:HemY protein
MRRVVLIVFLITALLGGLFIGPRLAAYQGYVLVVMEHGTFQLSVLGAILVLTLAMVVFMLVRWLSIHLIGLLSGSQSWLLNFSERRRIKAFRGGLIALAEGDSQGAIKHLDKVSEYDFDGLNLLAVAEAHLRQGNPEAALLNWQEASSYSKSELAAKTQLIHFYLQRDQYSQALELIEQLSEKQKKQPRVIKLWVQSLAKAGHWQQLQDRLPRWKAILGDKYDQWQEKTWQGYFAEIASKSGAAELTQFWQQLPRGKRKEVGAQMAYVQQLIAQNMHQDAEKVLVESLAKQAHPDLLGLFRQLKLNNPLASQRFLEERIKSEPNNAEYYSLLGQIAFNANNLSLADKALNKALHLGNHAEDMFLLAQIREAQHQDPQALQLYKQGLAKQKTVG